MQKGAQHLERDQETRRMFLGVDVGGTSVRVGAFDLDYKQLSVRQFHTRVADGPVSVISEIAEAVKSVQLECGVSVRSVGVGSPGPLNLCEGKLLELPNFPG